MQQVTIQKFKNKSNTFLSFRAVSIDPDSIYKQPNGIIISDGNKKINKLLNNGKQEEIDRLDIDFQKINEEMKIRRKIVEEQPWWYRKQKEIRKQKTITQQLYFPLLIRNSLIK